MPRSSRPPATDAEVQRLTQAVQVLSQHVQALYATIDEFRLDFAALLERHAPPTPRVVNTFPRDPTGADWNERLHRYSVADDERSEPAAAEPSPTLQPITQQRRLWAERAEQPGP